jgi:hypothetical protein
VIRADSAADWSAPRDRDRGQDDRRVGVVHAGRHQVAPPERRRGPHGGGAHAGVGVRDELRDRLGPGRHVQAGQCPGHAGADDRLGVGRGLRQCVDGLGQFGQAQVGHELGPAVARRLGPRQLGREQLRRPLARLVRAQWG